MKRIVQTLSVLIIAVIALPPLWFAIFPTDPPPDLPAAGTRIELAGGVGVNVVEDGSGAPVVLVHGLPGSVEYPGASHMLPITHADDLAGRISRFKDSGSSS